MYKRSLCSIVSDMQDIYTMSQKSSKIQQVRIDKVIAMTLVYYFYINRTDQSELTSTAAEPFRVQKQLCSVFQKTCDYIFDDKLN